ncbi:hypothetical protein Pint_20674 [Pistacia integerrima]|uniref:Uncharacterized protein n=1 Tax=Pistacia integerrima TaxID=434235 RepID=A0ACC0XE28_9ROSI|nr:hypothetical protein Pint_20674 [Pistacia integerrima]
MFQVRPLEARTINDSEEEVVDRSHLINIPEEEVKSLITDGVAEKFKSLDDAIVQEWDSHGELFEPRPRKDGSLVINIPEKEVKSLITDSVAEKFKSLDHAIVQENCRQKIQKVPSILRDNKKFIKHYEPRMIAIGPYHHNNPNLKNTEMLKLKLAALFIEKHQLDGEVLYSKVRRNIKHLRECYQEEETEPSPDDDEEEETAPSPDDDKEEEEEETAPTPDDDEEEETAPFPDDDDLAWMFFVDGCVLLHYIEFAVLTDKKDPMIEKFKEKGIKVDYLVYVQQDLFLLENQLPYGVLKLLISCLSDKGQMEKSIEKFIFGTIKAPRKKDDQLELKLLQKENPIHLLDLLRTGLLQFDDKENQMSCPIVGQPIENDLQFFRNVKELKAAGIRFRPSDTGCLKDITFEFGTLRLPSIQVDDSTASKFLNLIAYEMCPDFLNDFGVSSYVAFLYILIDQAQDVKELRDKQILHNFLGSDEKVAELFNEIGTDLVSNPSIYGDVKSKIQRHYDSKFMTSTAQFIHKYFRSPWSAIAFLAAIIALALTVAQTVYTILGYYK